MNLATQMIWKQKKYHDFIEVATETISDYSKEVDGKKVPMWNREEVNEIVIAQVIKIFPT